MYVMYKKNPISLATWNEKSLEKLSQPTKSGVKSAVWNHYPITGWSFFLLFSAHLKLNVNIELFVFDNVMFFSQCIIIAQTALHVSDQDMCISL